MTLSKIMKTVYPTLVMLVKRETRKDTKIFPASHCSFPVTLQLLRTNRVLFFQNARAAGDFAEADLQFVRDFALRDSLREELQ